MNTWRSGVENAHYAYATLAHWQRSGNIEVRWWGRSSLTAIRSPQALQALLALGKCISCGERRKSCRNIKCFPHFLARAENSVTFPCSQSVWNEPTTQTKRTRNARARKTKTRIELTKLTYAVPREVRERAERGPNPILTINNNRNQQQQQRTTFLN